MRCPQRDTVPDGIVHNARGNIQARAHNACEHKAQRAKARHVHMRGAQLPARCANDDKRPVLLSGKGGTVTPFDVFASQILEET